MLPYFLVNIWLSLTAIFENRRNSSYLFSFSVLVMLLFAGLRKGGTGAGDYDAYLRLYQLFETVEDVFNVNAHTEIGFRLLSLLGNSLGFEGQFIIATMAILSILPVVYVIYTKSQYKLLSLVVWFPYVLSMNMHSSRISVAAAFGLVCLILLIEKRYVLSIIFLTLSILFHTSGLILFAALLMYLPIIWLVNLLVFTCIIALTINPIALLSYFLSAIGFDKASNFLNIYLNSTDYGYPMPLYDPRILLAMFVTFLVCKAYKTEKLFNQKLYKLYILGFFIMVFFSQVTILAWRASYYYLIIGVLVIPQIAKNYDVFNFIKNDTKRIMSVIFIQIYSLWAFAFIVKALPYRSVF